MAFSFVHLTNALVGLRVDHCYAALVFAESDEHGVGSLLVAHVVGIFAEVDRFAQRVGCAVIDADFTVLGIGDIELVDARNVEWPLRLSQASDAVDYAAGKHINDFHGVIAERRNKKPLTLRVGGEVVDSSSNSRHGNLLFQLQGLKFSI